ncbi:MAG: hypothetical protein MK074_08290 [Phycisphaerales bacterium]|nr:hypothetical protein [Phycisphaerales bacterium]
MTSLLGHLPNPAPGTPLPTVLLRHDTPDGGWHLDWMVARDDGRGPLATWRLPGWPARHGEVGPVVALDDHDRSWLIRGGVVSGDRGHARRIDEGWVESCQIEPGEAIIEVRWAGRGRQSLSLLESSGEGWLVRLR